MSRPKKVIDLVMSQDGSYSQQRVYDKPTPPHDKGILHALKGEKPKYLLRCDVDEFLGGLDAGMDFVEGIRSRVNRIMSFRD